MINAARTELDAAARERTAAADILQTLAGQGLMPDTVQELLRRTGSRTGYSPDDFTDVDGDA